MGSSRDGRNRPKSGSKAGTVSFPVHSLRSSQDETGSAVFRLGMDDLLSWVASLSVSWSAGS